MPHVQNDAHGRPFAGMVTSCPRCGRPLPSPLSAFRPEPGRGTERRQLRRRQAEHPLPSGHGGAPARPHPPSAEGAERAQTGHTQRRIRAFRDADGMTVCSSRVKARQVRQGSRPHTHPSGVPLGQSEAPSGHRDTGRNPFGTIAEHPKLTVT